MSMPPLTIGAEEQLFSENVLASPSQNSPMAAAPASATLPASTNSNQIPIGNSTGTKVSSTASGEGSSQVNAPNTLENCFLHQICPIAYVKCHLLYRFQLLTKPRLQELVREIDPTEQLDEEVEELLLQIADDFVENTVNAACLLAKHRKVTKVEVRDVQLHLERNWNMWIPGFGTDELRPYKRAVVTEAHKQRLALIRKAIKKY